MMTQYGTTSELRRGYLGVMVVDVDPIHSGRSLFTARLYIKPESKNAIKNEPTGRTGDKYEQTNHDQ